MCLYDDCVCVCVCMLIECVCVGWVGGGNLFFKAAASFDKRIDTFQVGDVGRDIVTIKVSVVLKWSSRCKQCCEH